MEHDDPAEALTELRERRPSRLELLQVAAGSGLAVYGVWALLLQPGFRRVPLRLQVRGRGAAGPRRPGGPGWGRGAERRCEAQSAAAPDLAGLWGGARFKWEPTALGQRGGLGGGPHPHSPAFRVQVPYVGASARQVEHVLSLLRGRPGKTVDLGSGDGRIVRTVCWGYLCCNLFYERASASLGPDSLGPQVLAAHRCGLRPAVGYELNPWLVGLARLRAWRAGCVGSVRFHREDLWKVTQGPLDPLGHA